MTAANREDAQAYLERAVERTRDVSSLPDQSDWQPSNAAVVGAGTMGSGIALSLADAGLTVTLVDRSEDSLKRGLAHIESIYTSKADRGKLSRVEADTRFSRITGSSEFSSIADADIVIEAVFEDLSVKQDVFAEIDGHARPTALIGTNTSSLDIDAIAASTTRPESVIGSHFFSPANVMRLLEVIPGSRTSPQTLARLIELGSRMGKTPVQAGNAFGFIGNAMLLDYLRQTHFLIEDGALPADVDRVLTEFGFAMGPFAMTDMSGHDIAIASKRNAVATRQRDRRYSDLEIFLVDSGRLGQKSGAGWYRYNPGSRTPVPDPDFDAELIDYSSHHGITRRDLSDEEILHRCLFALVNRAAHLLADGIALRASDIDVVYVTGYGFPPATGGPLHWADSLGLDTVLTSIERFHSEDKVWWKPAPLLVELVRTGRSFADIPPAAAVVTHR